jgi:flagellar basal-body rod modification protein FlgD
VATTVSSTSSSVDPLSAGASATDQSSGNTLGKDDFLKLMMAQLQNQDPTAPMDNQAFVAQLAQFSNLEQLQGVNTRLDSLTVGQAGANQQAAANLVGKDVSYKSSSVAWTQGTSGAAIGAQLTSQATTVTATIKDPSGAVVRTLRYGAEPAGNFSATWDGLDDHGNVLPSGTYTLSVAAADGSGKAITTTAQGSGRVTGVSFATGSAQLVVNGQFVPLSDVIEVDQPKN